MEKKEKKIRVTEIVDGIRISESESGSEKEMDLTWEQAKMLICRIAERLPTIRYG